MQPILKINLTTGETSQITIPVEWEREYLGGASLAARFLYDALRPEREACDPASPLLFLTGPLSGTAGPAVGRFVVCGRSPATGLWGESNCGSFWGAELRMAGFDGLWIEGRANAPCYLWIQDQKIEIRSADSIWGCDTYTTNSLIEAELAAGKVRVASIGLAGERQLRFALILVDHGRVAGRTGLGAVLGAKKLKAIAVQGHGKVPVVDSDRYLPLRSEANRVLRADSQSLVLRELGTAGPAEYFDYLGEMPKRYYQEGQAREDLHVSGAVVKETLLAGVSACHACVIACGRVVRRADGSKAKGPEYETLVGFGPNLLLNDAALATHLGELCDRYGMDTISVSNTIGLAFRLFELGRITPADTGGLELHWGNGEVVESLIHQIVDGKGFGAQLAQGARKLGQCYGAEAEALQVNGLETAYHDPRGATGMALVYATSPRGACHNQSDYFLADVGQIETSLGMEYYDRQGGVEKAANVATHQNWRTVFNALVLCFFANLSPETVVELVNAACGYAWEIPDLLRCGERAWNLKRVINYRLGLRGEHDRLPSGFSRPYSDSEDNSEALGSRFQAMLEAYYQARSWESDTGFPSQAKLAQLGLEWVSPHTSPISPSPSQTG